MPVAAELNIQATRIPLGDNDFLWIESYDAISEEDVAIMEGWAKTMLGFVSSRVLTIRTIEVGPYVGMSDDRSVERVEA